MISSFQAHVFGRVQGVGFRYFTLNTANSIGGITGFVRNEYDGGVEIYAEGKKKVLEIFLDRIKIGPTYGHVENISVMWNKTDKRHQKIFKITY